MDRNSSKIARGIRYGLSLAMLIIQSCSAAVVETPTLDQPSPNQPTPTVERPTPTPPMPTSEVPAVATPTMEQPSPATPTPTSAIVEVTPSPAIEPPAGFEQYQDPVAGVSVYIPESWVVTGVVPDQWAILQSYPDDKYVGGEAFQPGDTKCDLTIRPPDVDVASHMQGLKSDPSVSIVSEGEMVLYSGKPGTRLEVDSMGRSLSLVTEVNQRVVVLTCFGDPAPFDQIVVTLDVADIIEGTPSPAIEPAAAFKQYQDSAAGVSVHMPGDWVVTGIVPGHRATLQSYPEDKYIGGEALESGDTKCDLSVRPPDISVADFAQQMKSNSAITILSEDEIILESGKPGIRIELESMGRSLLLIAEVNERVVV